MDNQSVEDLYGFLRVQNDHAKVNLASEQFKALIPPVNDAYEAVRLVVSKEVDLTTIRLLLLCHRSFLLAVSLIAGGHPIDAGSVTRRAIEMAKIAFALVYDSENFDRWVNYNVRSGRWAAWSADKKPPRLFTDLKLPKPHPLLDALGKEEGMYSDIGVHCTTEFMAHYPFEQQEKQLFLSYFVTDRDHINLNLRISAATHLLILQLFNETLRGAFNGSTCWVEAIRKIADTGLSFVPSEIRDQKSDASS